jgi:hypothetical protein
MKQHVFREIRAPAAVHKLLSPLDFALSQDAAHNSPEGAGSVVRTWKGRAVDGVWIRPGLRHGERRME